MPKADKCSGCTEDFYNGHNPLGVKECWSLKTAVLVRRLRIPMDLRPPYLHIKPISVYQCRHEKGYVLVKPEAITSQGYWTR